MKEYGYLWDGMKEVSYNEALKLFDENKCVYLLYEDNTEAQVENNDDITKHYNNGGLFGIEKYPDTDDEIKKVTVQCLDCGHEFMITCNELYCDELGHFAVCPVCSGSFDVDIKDFDLKEENNNG